MVSYLHTEAFLYENSINVHMLTYLVARGNRGQQVGMGFKKLVSGNCFAS